MTHIPGTSDAELHDEETGEHVGTARTTDGRDLEQHERRIKAHLEAHRTAKHHALTERVLGGYQAQCQHPDCGWRGPVRTPSRIVPDRVGQDAARDDADEDGEKHEWSVHDG